MNGAAAGKLDSAMLDRWLSGAAFMPDDKLLALIDLVDPAAQH